SRRRSTATADSPDPFRNRELQGGVTGSLRLDTESVGAVFSAGRIAGLTTGEAALTPATRAQGFSQNSETTRYLETVSAAWFTGLRVRGVHEVANLPGTASVGITTFAMDQLPGLVMNITAQRSSSRGAEAIMRHALLEVPLYDIADTSRPRTGAILESSGDVREIAILPQLDDGLRDGADPVEWSIGAVGLRVDLAEASLWIIAAHPGAVLPICFSLGARAVSGGVRVSWYPMGFERHRTADPVCARWSVSYRIVATDQNSAALVSPRVEPDVAAEIDGFTCQRAVPGRNVPAT
ncbi:MAG TPA: hypothetical protein VJ932_07260, partial [Alkalispirochaeta sp.]|nr:hypothetical protein [Alkalispirochaeta sp.]